MSVNIQQADKTLKKVADTTVVNKSTVTSALGYTPVKPEELNTAKTELNSSITILSTNTTTSVNNLQQQIDALEGSAFDGDYNKLKNAPILNDADGTATFVDETGNIIARIDNNGFETTNLNLHGDIELADEKLEIVDETGNIVLRIDDNGVETAITEKLKEQVDNNKTAINTKAPIDSPTFTGIPKAPTPEEGANAEQVATVGYVAGAVADLPFEFNDDGALTIADEQGNILAQFAVEEDTEGNAIETGLKVTDVATNNINSLNTEISNINTKINNRINAANSATADNIVLFTDTHNIKDSGKKIVTTIDDANIPTGKAIKDYVSGEIASYDENANAAISQTYATKTELDNKATELSGATAAVATDLEEHITETDGRGKLHITAAERTAWDAAKDYNNLENKPIEQDGNDKEFIITYNDENHIMARINDTGLRVLDVEIGLEGSSTTLSKKFDNIDTELDNRYTKTETDEKIDTKIAALVASAPEALNTLDELAAALGDDPNFATTVLTEIGKKANSDDVSTQFNALNFYKTVNIGSTPIEAKGNDDTLTFKPGPNIILGVDENNIITISSVDTNLEGVDILGSGNAVTSGSYNTKTKKVVLTKGETFATKQEHDNHVTEYTTFKTNFDEKFSLEASENGLDITDGNNIIATFDADGLRTTTVILGNTNNGILIDLMNIDYDSLFAFNVNEIVGGETSPVELASDELLLTDLDGDYVVVEKGE